MEFILPCSTVPAVGLDGRVREEKDTWRLSVVNIAFPLLILSLQVATTLLTAASPPFPLPDRESLPTC
jgi:hypothetical protein